MATEQFGPYRLDALIGEGGMGEVYRAFDTEQERTVALKVLPASLSRDPDYRGRFRREARLAAQLTDPHVVPVHRHGEIDGRLFLDMRLVEGDNLAVVLRRDGPLGADLAVRIVEQVASALDAAHEAGLVHRDVKPSNVFLTRARPGSPPFAYLGDFGIARALSSTTNSVRTGTGLTLGTIDYMAPERFLGHEIDRGVDIYALACVLFETLTGRKPYLGEDLPALMHAHIAASPPRPTQYRPVPPGLDGVVARGMAKEPADRHRSAGELAAHARGALSGSFTVGMPAGPSAPTPSWSGPPGSPISGPARAGAAWTEEDQSGPTRSAAARSWADRSDANRSDTDRSGADRSDAAARSGAVAPSGATGSGSAPSTERIPLRPAPSPEHTPGPPPTRVAAESRAQPLVATDPSTRVEHPPSDGTPAAPRRGGPTVVDLVAVLPVLVLLLVLTNVAAITGSGVLYESELAFTALGGGLVAALVRWVLGRAERVVGPAVFGVTVALLLTEWLGVEQGGDNTPWIVVATVGAVLALAALVVSRTRPDPLAARLTVAADVLTAAALVLYLVVVLLVVNGSEGIWSPAGSIGLLVGAVVLVLGRVVLTPPARRVQGVLLAAAVAATVHVAVSILTVLLDYDYELAAPLTIAALVAAGAYPIALVAAAVLGRARR